MQLNLKRPIAFFDLESTGVNVATDRIVELSFLKINPDGTEEIRTRRINPTIPIPAEASAIHGIYDEDVKNEPTFTHVAYDLSKFLKDSDLGGYNSNKFDIPMLVEEFLRSEIEFDMEGRRTVDVQNIFHQMEQRTLKAAYKFYCGKEIVHAHSAEADIKATYNVLLAQLDKYQEVKFEDKKGNWTIPVVNDIEALHRFTTMNQVVDFAGRMIYNEENIEIFNFGKHKGKKVEEVFKKEPSYFDWMMNGDFTLDTKRKLTQIRLRSFGNQ
jgi:DNA polymerase III subunit epsilon